MRSRLPWWLLLVAFIVVPLAEVILVVQVGRAIGGWWTVALLILDSVLGAWLVKREGARAWRTLRIALREGRMPARELADGMLVLIGGTLMLTPGFISDALGVLCILPFTRPLARRILTDFISRKLVGGPIASGAGMPYAGFFRASSSDGSTHRPSAGATHSPGFGTPGPSADDVVRGEVVDRGDE